MKKLLLALLFCIVGFALSAHAQKITVYCTVSSNGKIDYGDLKKLLPDSTSAKLLVDPRTQYGIKKSNHTLLLMSTYGWKLASVITNVSGGGGTFTSSSSEYLMSKEIYLDAASYGSYLNNLIHIETK